MSMADVPEWAIETAREINLTLPYVHVQGEIARALVAAERRGIERAADAYRDGAGPEDGRWDYFLSAELAIRQLGASE